MKHRYLLALLPLFASCGGNIDTQNPTPGEPEPEVPEKVAVSRVELSETSLTLEVSQSSTLTATVYPSNADEQTVSWSSSDPSVATVSEGTIEAVRVGTTTVKASCGGKSAVCKVTVNPKQDPDPGPDPDPDPDPDPIPVASVQIDTVDFSIQAGLTALVHATVLPDDADDKTLTWSSSDPAVASVVDGLITAIKEGIVTITARASDKSATITVTVVPVPLPEPGAEVPTEPGVTYNDDEYGSF